MNARSINVFKFTAAYDGEFYDPDEIDIEDITVDDNYFILNESEVTRWRYISSKWLCIYYSNNTGWMENNTDRYDCRGRWRFHTRTSYIYG